MQRLAFLSFICLLTAGTSSAARAGKDSISAPGTVIEAEAAVDAATPTEHHPLASAGRMVRIDPGKQMEFKLGIDGKGLLFVHAIGDTLVTNMTVSLKGASENETLRIDKGLAWTDAYGFDFKPDSILVLSLPGSSSKPVYIDRFFFSPDLTTRAFGKGRRNDLTAWTSRPDSSRQPYTGNLIRNGGFETPFGDEWFTAWFAPFFLEDKDRITDKTGNRFLRIPLDRFTSNGRITIVSSMIETRPGIEYTFSCDLRGTGKCRIHLPGDLPSTRDVSDDKGLVDYVPAFGVNLTPEWRTITTNFQGGGRLIVELSFPPAEENSGTYVDMDNVGIFESSLNTMPVNPIEAGLTLPDPAHIYTEGSPLDSHLVCRFGTATETALNIKTFDTFGNMTATKTIDVTGNAGVTTETPFPLDWIDPHPCGSYRIEIWHKTKFLKEQVLCVLPEPLPLKNSTHLFGAYCAASDEIIPVLKRLGITSVGSQNLAKELSKLKTIMPHPDKPVLFNTGYSQRFHDAGIEVTATLLGTPPWLDRTSPSKQQLVKFSEKLRSWVEAHKGTIDSAIAWMEQRQVDNPEFYKKLIIAADKGLSSAKPPVDMLCAAGTPEQAKTLLTSQAPHVAGFAAQLRYSTDEDLQAWLEFTDKHHLKLWDMEAITWRKSFYRQHFSHNSYHKTDSAVLSPSYACARLVKSVLRSRVLAGMERFMYYYMGPASTWFGWLHYNGKTLTEFDGTIHPIGTALAYLTSRIDRCTAARALDMAEGIATYGFENTRGATVVAWCEGPVSALISQPESRSCLLRDITGRPFTSSTVHLSRIPVLVTSKNLSLDQLTDMCRLAISKPLRAEPAYRTDATGQVELGLVDTSPVEARPFEMESPWMESARDNPTERQWKSFPSGFVPLSEAAVVGIDLPAVEFRAEPDTLWQIPINLLIAYPDNTIHVGRFDNIILNARIQQLLMRRGRTSDPYDLGILVSAGYNTEMVTLAFSIADNRLVDKPGNIKQGDVLKLFIGEHANPVVIEPTALIGLDPALEQKPEIRLKHDITATLSLSQWGWHADIAIPGKYLGDFQANTSIPFGFEYRDADDSMIQQRAIQWGMLQEREVVDCGRLLFAPMPENE